MGSTRSTNAVSLRHRIRKTKTDMNELLPRSLNITSTSFSAAVENLHVRAGLFASVRMLYTVVCVPGVAIDILGQHATKWEKGVR